MKAKKKGVESAKDLRSGAKEERAEAKLERGGGKGAEARAESAYDRMMKRKKK